MEKDLDKGQKKEEIDPIMMDEYQIKEIIDRVGMTCSRIPYQFL
jgi:hypothetical protein